MSRAVFLMVAALVAASAVPASAEDDRYVGVQSSRGYRAGPPPAIVRDVFRPFLPRASSYTPSLFSGWRSAPSSGGLGASSIYDDSDDIDYRGGDSTFSTRITGSGGGHTVICVRTCDGFYFPVTGQDYGVRDTMCRASCPDGDPVLFEGSGVDDSRDAAGRRYGDLPTAFLYRTKRVDQCTCRRDPGDASRRLPIASDPTLRRGDIVTTEASAYVFTGGRGNLPYRMSDFQSFETSPLVSKGERSRLAGILGQTREQLLARAGKPLDRAGSAAAAGSGSGTGRGDDDLPSIVVTRPGAGKPVVATSADGPRVVLPSPVPGQSGSPQL